MEIIETLVRIISEFSFKEALISVKPILLFILGMVVYSVFIFKFYRFVAHREIFKFSLSKYNNSQHAGLKKFLGVVIYIFEHIILFPVLTFFWFIVLSAILIFLSKDGNPERILVVAISLVGAIRIVAYYTEELSKDLAKMLPFALLGIFLADVSYFSFERSFEVLRGLPALWDKTIYYLAFIVLLEIILRVGHLIVKMSKPRYGKDIHTPKIIPIPSS